MKKYLSIRENYPDFYFKNFDFKKRGQDFFINFYFEVPSKEEKKKFKFCHLIKIKNIDLEKINKIPQETIENFIFNIGISEILNYWKLFCSKNIFLPFFLSDEQLKFWKKFFIKSMGQYFFENEINFKEKNFLNFIVGEKEYKKENIKLKDRYLLSLGEGKDSITSLEILKDYFKEKYNEKLGIFLLNKNIFHEDIILISNIKNKIFVERILDKKLFELNNKGFLNGHIPITGIYSFIGSFVALIFDYKNLVFSNEKSTFEGNVKYLGTVINHQWSKTFQFENLFRDYLNNFLIEGLNYFSLQRPLYEIEIARIFKNFPQYFYSFSSCNIVKKITNKSIFNKKWCGKCPKCLFVFILLYPFLGKEETIKIFGKNLFKDKSLKPLLEKMLGLKGFKPFECLGTKKEIELGLYLSLLKTKEEGKKLPFLLSFFENYMLKNDKNIKRSVNILTSFDKKNNIPKDIKYFILEKYVKRVGK